MKLDIEIVDKYINDRVTSEEREQVLAWLSTDEGQKALALHLEQTTQTLTDEKAQAWLDHIIPTERMKQHFIDGISSTRKWRIWLKVAAVLLPLFGLSFGVLFLSGRLGIFTEPEYAFIEVPCGEQIRVVLQDGTLVHLNSSSSMRYPKRMGLFNRKVELAGEAYFQVAKDENRPFIIDLNGVDIRVTGTEFNVKAYSDDTYVEVMLKEGGVLLENKANCQYRLKPGEFAGYNRKTGLCNISKVVDEQVITSWRSRSLNFYRTPFKEILKILERQYDVTFQVEDTALLDVHFTLSTNKVQISDILKDLSIVSSIHFTDKDKEGRMFIVTSNGK